MYMLFIFDLYRFLFVMDIVRGMVYIYFFKIYYGYLKSSNCVVDDRWIVKIVGGLFFLDLFLVWMMFICMWYKGGKI